MKEMGIPMGPRKKLMGFLRNQKLTMVIIQPCIVNVV